MELFQELLFTISLSLIVSLLIVKLFSMASGCEDGNSTVSKRVEEKMEKEWVFCDSEKEEKTGYFEDAIEVSYGNLEAELGSGCLMEDIKSVGEVGVCQVFDESPEITHFKDAVVSQEVGVCQVFDESPERTHFEDADVVLVKSGEVNVKGSLMEEDCVKSIELSPESTSVDGGYDGACYVFDESPERTHFKDAAVSLVKSGEVNVKGSLMEEDCMKSIELSPESTAVDGGCDGGEVKIDDGDGVLYDDWQGIETTELEKNFGAAVAFMGSKISADRVSGIDNEVKLQLYGLHKVALEGPCFESQPMALKISARANWNAWKRVENLGREDAMAQYIALLSRHVPDWMGNQALEDDIQDFVATGTYEKLHSDDETPNGAESERTPEQMNPCNDPMTVEDSNITIRKKQ